MTATALRTLTPPLSSSQLQKEIYGPKALWQGFRTPPLIRFVSNEDAYLALTHDGPRMFINLEDYVTHNGAAPNTPFFAVVSLLMVGAASRPHAHSGTPTTPSPPCNSPG